MVVLWRVGGGVEVRGFTSVSIKKGHCQRELRDECDFSRFLLKYMGDFFKEQREG
jgi:hypothetical protein